MKGYHLVKTKNSTKNSGHKLQISSRTSKNNRLCFYFFSLSLSKYILQIKKLANYQLWKYSILSSKTKTMSALHYRHKHKVWNLFKLILAIPRQHLLMSAQVHLNKIPTLLWCLTSPLKHAFSAGCYNIYIKIFPKLESSQILSNPLSTRILNLF